MLAEPEMHPIVYDVAVSIDGFIAGPSDDISKFPHEGPVVDDYRARLAGYAVAIMGKRTYEFGYRFGLKPGANPYQHMRTIVFSSSIDLPKKCEVEVQRNADPQLLRDLKASSNGPIYLCGGGDFAGALLGMGLVDLVRLKRAPILLGGGVPLFEGTRAPSLRHLNTKNYNDGYAYQEFETAI